MNPLAVAYHFVDRAVLGPIRDGRLRRELWPAGLYPIAATATIGYAVAGLVTLLAPWIRQVDTLQVVQDTSTSIPSLTLPLLMPLLILTLSLAHAAALHCTWWVKAIGLALTVQLAGLFISHAVVAGQVLGWTVGAGSLAALVGFSAWRWWGRFAWWEFPVVAVLIAAATQVPLITSGVRSWQFGYDGRATLFILVAGALAMLALPTLFAAGASLAEVSVGIGLAVADTLRRQAGAGVWLGVGGVVVAWRVFDLGLAGLDAGAGTLPGELLTASTQIALAAAAAIAVTRLVPASASARGVPVSEAEAEAEAEAESPGNPFSVLGQWSDWLLILAALQAALLPLSLPASLVMSVAGSLGLPDVRDAAAAVVSLVTRAVPLAVTRMVGAVLVLVIAVVMVRRGRRVAAFLLSVAAIYPLLTGLGTFLPVSTAISPRASGLLLTAVLLVALAVAWATGRRDPATLAALLAGLLLTGFHAHRSLLADPITALLGFSTVAVLLFGLVWRVLTDGWFANGDSRAFPRPARVLLFLANSLLAVVLVAYVALSLTTSGTLDFPPVIERGDEMLGVPLLVSVTLACLVGAFERRVL